MLKIVLYPSLATTFLFAALQSASNPGPHPRQDTLSPTEQDMKIEIKLSPLKNVIVSGQSLRLAVEIWNDGPTDVYVCKEFETPAGPLCTLTLNMQDSSGTHGSQYGLTGDVSPWRKEPLSAALARDWIALRRGHFYGAIITADPDSYPWLRKPGNYHVLGQFTSGGLMAYQGTVLSDPEEVAHLPARFWKGRVDSNYVVIRVTPKNN